ALRGLETGRFGLGCDQKDRWGKPEQPPMDDVMRLLAMPNADRIWHIRYAYKMGMTTEEIHGRTKIDPWFLNNMRDIIAVEDKLRACPGLEAASDALLWEAKQAGFSDRQLAHLWDTDDMIVRDHRKARGIEAVFKCVDTCAAEFEAFTPYYYSAYERPANQLQIADCRLQIEKPAPSSNLQSAICNLQSSEDETRPPRDNKERIVILGGGPNRIGQGIEFDYCCCHAAFALKAAGFETIMVNSNPETVSTDYDTSDMLFFEPLTTEDVLNICDRIKPKGLIVQFGGQTPLNLAKALEAAGAPIIGTSVDSIDIAEDRKRFGELVDRLNLKQPPARTARDLQGAVHAAREMGYPVLVRPSYVLGGRAMEIVYDEDRMKTFVNQAIEVSAGKPILIDQFLESAVEVDVDCLSDGTRSIIGGVMQHIEEAGVHSGDSACVIPPYSLPADVIAEIKRQTRAMALELKVKGLMNVQFAVTGFRRPAACGAAEPATSQGATVYVLEVNPRASRTVPFVAK